MKHSMQISESIGLGTILALSGGFMDAYSYIERGKVFANAQTGNMLLFGVNLSEGNYQTMLNYLFPVLAFALGIALAEHGPYKRTEPASLETDFCPYRNPDPDCSQFLSYDAQSACQLAYLFCLWHSG